MILRKRLACSARKIPIADHHILVNVHPALIAVTPATVDTSIVDFESPQVGPKPMCTESAYSENDHVILCRGDTSVY
ncbi:hypothetical protein BCAR13_90039 [Paraburkholderia caribensis]|nr:hypothetical protein BCAR13_90039 [Paraburkholderia caribensis]